MMTPTDQDIIESSATDADIVEALAETFRESRAAAVPGAFRLVVERLRDRYGRRLVDRAVLHYERTLRQENRRLKRENQRLERQWLKRQTGRL